jgi:hypothetical protein
MSTNFTSKNGHIDGHMSLWHNNIHIKLKENAFGYDIYEGKYTKEHFNAKITFDIEGIYQIIRNCVLHNDDNVFSYKMHPLNDSIKLCFSMNFCKDVELNFDIDVDKKNISENEKSFVEFMSDIKKELVKLKQSNNELIEKCEKNAKTLELQDDIIENTLRHGFINFQQWENPDLRNKISLPCKYTFVDKHIECKHTSEHMPCYANNPHQTNWTQHAYAYDFSLLQTFINLESLETYTINCGCVNKEYCSNYIICKEAYNNNMYKIIAHNHPASHMFNLNQFPNLTDIEFINCGAMTSCEIISELETKDHNVKNIKIISCGKIDMAELQTYCSSVNITVTTQ